MSIHRFPAFLFSLLCVSLNAGSAAALDLHVSPGGNDAAGGRTAGQALASLEGARDAVRRIRAKGPLEEPIRVIVAHGTYFLSAPLVLGPDDGGTRESPVVYEAAPGARPIFTGGLRIRGFEARPDGLWSARAPQVGAAPLYFEQLWVNGRRAVRARSPNKFYHYVKEKVEYGRDPATGRPVSLAGKAFRPYSEDLKPLLAIPKERLRDVTFVM